MKKLLLLTVLFLVVMVAQSYGFRSFRCSKGLVSVGDHKDKILAKCGEPDLIDWERYYSAEVPRSQGPITLKWQTQEQTRSQRLTTTVEKWTYNFGPNRFLQILTFEGSKLVDIEEGDYGW